MTYLKVEANLPGTEDCTLLAGITPHAEGQMAYVGNGYVFLEFIGDDLLEVKEKAIAALLKAVDDLRAAA